MLLSASATPTLPATDRSVRIQVFRTSVCPHEARSDVAGLQTSSRPPSCPTLNLLFPPVAACNFHEENAKPGRDTHGDRRASSPRTNQGTSGCLSGPALSWSGQRQPSGSLRKHRILTTSTEPFRGFLPFSFRVQMIWNGTEKGWGRKIQTHLPA